MRPDEFMHVLRAFNASKDYRVDNPYLHSLFFELVFWVLVLGITLLLVRRCRTLFWRGEQLWGQLAGQRRLSLILVGLSALVLRLALLPLVPIPEPVVHDEYSYILQAETFASGRLTNPPHPMWTHFETFHVNMLPTYQSMYPPAQALFMALGLTLFGHPWWGIWLSAGLMCVAVTWALQGLMPPRWALLGGAFCVLRFSLFSYWVDSYFGGTIPAIGGALVMGAVVRLTDTPRVIHSLLLASGLLILANSRPYEGLVFSLVPVLWLAVCVMRKRGGGAQTLARVVAPATVVLLVGAAGMAYYNWRGTGHLLLMPYVLNQQTYHISKPFLWQTHYPIPNYRHLVMRTFYCYHELPSYLISHTAWGLWDLTQLKFRVYYEFFFWPLMGLLVPAWWMAFKSRRMRLPAMILGTMLIGVLIESWLPQGHYGAPATCVAIAMIIYGLRLLRRWRPLHRAVGPMMFRAVILIVLAWIPFPLGNLISNPYLLDDNSEQHLLPELDRARLQSQLERLPGQHLVIVHNRRGWTGHQDWVYNKPDIDHAKIVWARDMGAEKNEELLGYFAGRRVWMVDQNDGIMRLNAYNEHTVEQTIAAALAMPAHTGTKLAVLPHPSR